MKRFHVNVSVADLGKSIEFYRTLFGEQPTLVQKDYAKWMLEDPCINFSISESAKARGLDHVGLQADTLEELGDIRARLRDAHAQTSEQENAHCCYAHSTKTWVRDPDDVVWETFVTHGRITRYGEGVATSKAEAAHADSGACCRG